MGLHISNTQFYSSSGLVLALPSNGIGSSLEVQNLEFAVFEGKLATYNR